MKILSSAIAAMLLAVTAAGCGSGGSDVVSSGTQATAPEAPAPAPASAPTMDAFTASVSDVVNTSSDTTEPVAIDTSSASSSESAEPAPVS